MANEEHLEILRSGVEVWNAWRVEKEDTRPDLRGADLGVANLNRADLRRANLGRADLSRADLSEANLNRASLSVARLNRANLSRADLSGADLKGANLKGVVIYETIFGNVDLTETKGLYNCHHNGPSLVDHRTLERSKNVPINFWRGCGLPDRLIDYLPSLVDDAIQFYSCFISYSSKDQEFANRLHADLQNAGVRCWFAQHDMRTGDRIRDAIDEQIRVHEKLLLILSESSVSSGWVENEVEAAMEKEEGRKTVLFPVRIDDAVEGDSRAWARTIKRTRHITDFSGWKDHDAYKKSFDRVLRDLQAKS